MFQFGRCPPRDYGFSTGYHPLPGDGLPHSEIVGSQVWSAPPRRFSQLPTSFFGTRRLGIHRMPFFLLPRVPHHVNQPRKPLVGAVSSTRSPSPLTTRQQSGATHAWMRLSGEPSAACARHTDRLRSTGTRRVVSSTVKVPHTHTPGSPVVSCTSTKGSGTLVPDPSAAFEYTGIPSPRTRSMVHSHNRLLAKPAAATASRAGKLPSLTGAP